MKKIALSMAAMMMAATTFISCGGDDYTNYVNEKHGYSIDVPSALARTDNPQNDDSPIFSYEGDNLYTQCGVSVNTSWDGLYNDEKINSEYEEATCYLLGEDGPRVKERTADGWVCTEEDDNALKQVKVIYKGETKYRIEYGYSKDKADQFGGEVMKHFFDSFTFTNGGEKKAE